MMETASGVGLLLLAFCVGTLSQSNTDELVPWSVVEAEARNCPYYGFVEYTGSNGERMVNRSYFYQLDLAGNKFLQRCGAGTLFSMKKDRCGCTIEIPKAPLRDHDRCVRLSGNFQTDASFTQVVTTVNGVRERKPLWVENFQAMPYSSSSQCYICSISIYPCVPFFDGNSLSFGQLEISLDFSISPEPTVNNVFPLIVNDGVYDNNTRTANPSFRLAYVVRGGQRLIEVTLRVRSRAEPLGSPETEVTLSCILGDIIRSGLPTIPWSVTERSNSVRLVGNLAEIWSMKIVVVNSRTASQTDIPAGGFCSATSISNDVLIPRGSRRLGGSGLIIAERADALGFGLVPYGYEACLSNLQIARDC